MADETNPFTEYVARLRGGEEAALEELIQRYPGLKGIVKILPVTPSLKLS